MPSPQWARSVIGRLRQNFRGTGWVAYQIVPSGSKRLVGSWFQKVFLMAVEVRTAHGLTGSDVSSSTVRDPSLFEPIQSQHHQASGSGGVFCTPWDSDVLDSAATVRQPPACSLTRQGRACCLLILLRHSPAYRFAPGTRQREPLQWGGHWTTCAPKTVNANSGILR